tara:strand:+ start:59 stop:520 length:462 start_codon:yes stop_codon:yes gene_type:complete
MSMDYNQIEEIYAKKHNTTTTPRKDIGDIYVNGIPWNIKSNNLDRQNYSPNLISADKLFDYLNSGKTLKFLFVDYKGDTIIKERLVDATHISWDCLTIQCQGKGVIQISSDLKVDEHQTKEKFLKGFAPAYKSYLKKERKKLDKIEQKYSEIL